jgi:hypothetical protein
MLLARRASSNALLLDIGAPLLGGPMPTLMRWGLARFGSSSAAPWESSCAYPLPLAGVLRGSILDPDVRTVGDLFSCGNFNPNWYPSGTPSPAQIETESEKTPALRGFRGEAPTGIEPV